MSETTFTVAIEHRTRFLKPRYEVRVGILFSELADAIIRTHKLYDHRVLTDLGDEILLKHIYHTTLVKRFDTPALAKTFDERLRAALLTLRGYLEFSAKQPDPTVYNF